MLQYEALDGKAKPWMAGRSLARYAPRCQGAALQQAKPIRNDNASATAGSCGFAFAQWQHKPSSLPMTPSGCARQPGPISAPQPRFPSLQWNRLLGWRAHPQGHLQGRRPRRGHRSPAEEALGTAKPPAGLAEDAMGTDVVADGAPERPRAHQSKVMPLKRIVVIWQLSAAARARNHCHRQPARNIDRLPRLRCSRTRLCQQQANALQSRALDVGAPWAAQQTEKHDDA